MREIKFRAWEDDVQFMNHDVQIAQRMGETFFEVSEGFGWKEVKKENVMQYTGLTDVNGVDIYGGDICEYQDGEYSFIAIIESDYVNWYLKGISPKDNFDINDYHDCGKSCLKVIGNIFQDKDLLKENEE